MLLFLTPSPSHFQQGESVHPRSRVSQKVHESGLVNSISSEQCKSIPQDSNLFSWCLDNDTGKILARIQPSTILESDKWETPVQSMWWSARLSFRASELHTFEKRSVIGSTSVRNSWRGASGWRGRFSIDGNNGDRKEGRRLWFLYKKSSQNTIDQTYLYKTL